MCVVKLLTSELCILNGLVNKFRRLFRKISKHFLMIKNEWDHFILRYVSVYYSEQS